MSVTPYGLGTGLPSALEENPLESITRWLPIHIPNNVVRDILAQKTLFPDMMPATNEALAIEQAVTRQVLHSALRTLPLVNNQSFEPILASGLALTQSNPGQCLMMLLDSIQPCGVTTFVIDPHGLTPALGAIAVQCQFTRSGDRIKRLYQSWYRHLADQLRKIRNAHPASPC